MPTNTLAAEAEGTVRRGVLFVISGPSGVGKGTIVKRLLANRPDIQLSVSVTTRNPRPGEVEGQSYYFRSPEEFERMAEASELLEYAQFVNGFYGTPRRFVEERLALGHDVILEIETKGAIQVKERTTHGVYIFVTPPSMGELASRLAGRQTEAEDVRQQRLALARQEIDFLPFYDYHVVNDDLDTAVRAIEAIFLAERCRVARNGVLA